MSLNLLKLKNISDLDFCKTIISSGDFFPGFYRFTMGTKKYEKGQLTLSGLIKTYFQQITGKKYTRNQWTNYTIQKHNSLKSRNLSRSDFAVYELLDRSYLNWSTTAKEYDIAVLEINELVEKIKLDETYFFMGSLIRFSKNKFVIGYDFVDNSSLMEIKINIDDLIYYTENIYKNNLKKFFIKCDVIAKLIFNDDVGTLILNEKIINKIQFIDPNSVIISSNRDLSKDLPIRWAKDISLSEVYDDSK
jgi:hypothetical protein